MYGIAVLGVLSTMAFTLAIVLLARRSVGWYFRGPLRQMDVAPYPASGDPSAGARPSPGAPATAPLPAPRAGGVAAAEPVGEAAVPLTAAARERELAVLRRRHQRGELTGDEYRAARRRLDEHC